MSFPSWGRYPFTDQKGVKLTSRFDDLPAADNFLPYGNGRSYGDSCLNKEGVVFSTQNLNHFIAFDQETGLLRCESGVLLKTILDVMVPQGWFLCVVPGTQFATVGGAIANDVHGKNHHVFGNFGHHIKQFELLRSDGQRLLCSPTENSDYFYASIGGLGLTGVITWADIQLRKVAGAAVEQENIKYQNLDDFFSLSEESEQEFEYTVAWLDCLASGDKLGRGHFTRANHKARADNTVAAPQRQLNVPITLPISPVNKFTLKAFNELYYHRQLDVQKNSTVHYAPYFFPLDSIYNWNRMYGKKGFLQYQCVLPPEYSKEGIRELIERIAKAKMGSFLAVLKVFGDVESQGWLSYPMAGANLALDFPYAGQKTHDFLNRLDEVVVQAGGRVYPAKDAHMQAEHFQQYYPRWEDLEQLRDPNINSSFWRRVTQR